MLSEMIVIHAIWLCLLGVAMCLFCILLDFMSAFAFAILGCVFAVISTMLAWYGLAAGAACHSLMVVRWEFCLLSR